MAFNLNKNESPAEASKISGFDLSKNNQQTEVQPKKSGHWPYVITALLIIGAITLYMNNWAIPSGRASNDSTTLSSINDSDTSLKKTRAYGKMSIGNAATSNEDSHEPPLRTAISQEAAAKSKAQLTTTAPITRLVAASFSTGSSTPKVLSRGILNMVKKSQAANSKLYINIMGYASSEGDPAVNLAISQARADSYKQYLVRNGCIETHILATGKGIENPIASNATEEGRGKNRRVEVSLNEQ